MLLATSVVYADPPELLSDDQREMLLLMTSPEPKRSGVIDVLYDSDFRPSAYPPAHSQGPQLVEWEKLAQEGVAYEQRLRDLAIVYRTEILQKEIPELDSRLLLKKAQAIYHNILAKRKTRQEKSIPFAQADQLAKEKTQRVFGDQSGPERDQYYKRELHRAEQATARTPRSSHTDPLTPAEYAELHERIFAEIAEQKGILHRELLLTQMRDLSIPVDALHIGPHGEHPLTLELLEKSRVVAPQPNSSPSQVYQLLTPNGETHPILMGDLGFRNSAEPLKWEGLHALMDVGSRSVSAGEAWREGIRARATGGKLEELALAAHRKEVLASQIRVLYGVEGYFVARLKPHRQSYDAVWKDFLSFLLFRPSAQPTLDREARESLDSLRYVLKIPQPLYEVYLGGLSRDPQYWIKRDALAKVRDQPPVRFSADAKYSSWKVAKNVASKGSRPLAISSDVGNFPESHLDETTLFSVSALKEDTFFHLVHSQTENPVKMRDLQARSRLWAYMESKGVPTMVASKQPVSPHANGRMSIPTPRGRELRSLTLSDENGRPLRRDWDYWVYFDPQEGGYWLEFAPNRVPRAVSFRAELQTAATPFQQGVPQVLPSNESQRIAAELRGAKLTHTAEFLEQRALKPGFNTLDLADALGAAGTYTYSPEKLYPDADANGPLRSLNRFERENVFTAQCSGGGELYCAVMEQVHARHPEIFSAQRIEGYQVSAGQGIVRAKHAHVNNVIVGSGGLPLYLDVTPRGKIESQPKTLADLPEEVRVEMELRAAARLAETLLEPNRPLPENLATLKREAWRKRLELRRDALKKVLIDQSIHYSELRKPGQWDPSLPHAQIPRILAIASDLESGNLTPEAARTQISELVPELRETLAQLGATPSQQKIFGALHTWGRETLIPRLEKFAHLRESRGDRALRFPSYSDSAITQPLRDALEAFAGAPPYCEGVLKKVLQSVQR